MVFCCFSSPRSGTSSNASTPSAKKIDGEKPTTPISKSVTPTSGGSGSSAAGASGMKPVAKPPSLGECPLTNKLASESVWIQRSMCVKAANKHAMTWGPVTTSSN